MRKLLLLAFLCQLIAAPALWADSTTPNLGMTLPTAVPNTWAEDINNNFIILDNKFPGGQGGHTIADEGVNLPLRGRINFVGAGVTATDNAGTNSINVTIGAGAGGSGVAGSNTQVQFNELGALSAHTGLTYDRTTQLLTVGARVQAPAFTGNLTGIANQAIQLVTPPTACALGQAPRGVDTFGNAFACQSITVSGGSAITGDLGNNGSNEITSLATFATTGDTDNIFTVPSAQKLLIDVSKQWPVATTALTAAAFTTNPANCSTGNAPLGIDAAGIAEGCFDVATQIELDTHTNLTTAHSATATNTANRIVMRDGSGNFAASTITATFVGNVTGNVTGNALTATTASSATSAGVANSLNNNFADSSCTHVGANDSYTCTPTIAPTSYVTNASYRFKAGFANTGAASINIASLGVKAIKKWLSGAKVDPVDNDICNGQEVDLVYDGTDMVMVSTVCNPSSGGGGGSGITATTGTILKAGSSTTGVDSSIVEDADSINFGKPIEACAGGPCLFSMNTSIFATTLKTWAYPVNADDTYVGAVATQTLTNKTISGSANTLTNIPVAAVAAALKTKSITFMVGADNGAALTTADSQPTFWRNNIAAMHITEIWCESDGGTPTINLQKDDGSPVNMLSSSLSCSTSGATVTSFVSGEDALASGDKLDLVIAGASTAKRVTVSIKATLD